MLFWRAQNGGVETVPEPKFTQMKIAKSTRFYEWPLLVIVIYYCQQSGWTSQNTVCLINNNTQEISETKVLIKEIYIDIKN